MNKRDLKADLELCNKATPGPWYRKKTGANFKGFSSEVIIADTSRYATGNKVYAEPKGGQFPANDADFIAQAREGWPHAIERALKAEALARELMYALEQHEKWENAFISGAFESFGVAYEAYETTRKIRTEILAKARRLLGDMDA